MPLHYRRPGFVDARAISLNDDHRRRTATLLRGAVSSLAAPSFSGSETGHIINPLDFGADPTGVHDASGAFFQAVKALTALGYTSTPAVSSRPHCRPQRQLQGRAFLPCPPAHDAISLSCFMKTNCFCFPATASRTNQTKFPSPILPLAMHSRQALSRTCPCVCVCVCVCVTLYATVSYHVLWSHTPHTRAFVCAADSQAFTRIYFCSIAFSSRMLSTQGLIDLGGATVDLQGGVYRLSAPFFIPQGYANFGVRGGTLVAAKNFTGASQLRRRLSQPQHGYAGAIVAPTDTPMMLTQCHVVAAHQNEKAPVLRIGTPSMSHTLQVDCHSGRLWCICNLQFCRHSLTPIPQRPTHTHPPHCDRRGVPYAGWAGNLMR